ncbi:MAG: aspartyl protease family protein, partial [Candidatus Zixiibacteriota bacterium]
MSSWHKTLALLFNVSAILVTLHASASGIRFTGEVVVQPGAEYVVPFLLEGHTIIVPVRINGSDKEYRFVFDTGGLTFVSESTATELELETGMPVPTYDPEVKAYSTAFDTISVGGAKVTDLVGVIFDFLARAGFRDLDGMIGSDFLSFFNVTIDYQKRKMTLSHNTDSLSAAEGTYLVGFGKHAMIGAPMIECLVNGHIGGQGMVDVGSPHGVVLPLSYVDRIYGYRLSQLIAANGEMARWPQSKDMRNYLGRLKSLTIGSLEIENVPVVFADVDDILIGREILEQFVSVINYPTDQMLIIPNKESRFQNNLFSFGLRCKRDDEGKLIVRGLWADAPAHRAGILVNDEILKIDSRDVSTYSKSNLAAIFSDDTVHE